MKAEDRELFAHLALALSRYVPEGQALARQNGLTVPPELLTMAERFAELSRDQSASTRQGATTLAPPAGTEQAGHMTNFPLLTKREAASSLRVSVRTLERLIASGALVAVKVEAATKVRRVDLDAYVAGLGPSRTFRDSVEEKKVAI